MCYLINGLQEGDIDEIACMFSTILFQFQLMHFLFIHSACVAVALLLPCALCDRISLPLQSIDRTSILISTKKRSVMVVKGKLNSYPNVVFCVQLSTLFYYEKHYSEILFPGEVDQEIREDRAIGSLFAREMTEKIKTGTARKIGIAERTGIKIEIRIETIKTKNVNVIGTNDAARKENVARKRNALVVENANVAAVAKGTLIRRNEEARKRTIRNIVLNLEVQNQKWTICLQKSEICVPCSACSCLKELGLKI